MCKLSKRKIIMKKLV